MYIRLISLFIVFTSVFGFWGDGLSKIPEPPVVPPYMRAESPWADSLIQTMSLDEKIGQLFMVAANGKHSDESDYLKIDTLLDAYGLGGLIYFQSEPQQHNILVNRFQSKSKIPLMNGIDGEWGLAMRIDSLEAYPWNMTLGAVQNDSLLYEMGGAIAQECKTMGVHFNFTPVVDVNSNPLNPIINARSYGENPINVSQKALALMHGMQDSGVLACAKHFPGHGDTDSDSHKTLPIIHHSKSRIDSVDLFPFKKLVDAGVASVMVAHLNIPALDSTSNRASTLSPYIVDTLLQQDLNFSGLVFTDALNMKGVSDYYDSGSLEVSALQAGNDVLLFPEDVPAAFEAIHRAIEDGLLTQNRINESCHKILKAKEWLGLTSSSILDTSNVLNRAQGVKTEFLRQRLESSALTLLKNKDALLPIVDLKNQKIAVLTLGEANSEPFVRQLKRYLNIHKYEVSLDEASDFDQLIISVHKSNTSPWKSYKISEEEKEMISLLSKETKVTLVIFANPYSLLNADHLENVNSIVMAYQNSVSMQSLAAQSLLGGIPITGKLPVSLTEEYKVDFGLSLNAIDRLKYTLPEEVGMNRDTLSLIDTLVNEAIKMKATPGCQVLVAKEGKVFYHKSFGYHTYDSLKMVDEFDVYDIASITKIASTLPIIMQKVDAGSFNVDKKIAKYLSVEDTCSKAKLTPRKMLSHQARLWPWIPFYRETLNENGHLNPLIYSDKQEKEFKIQVAKDIFMNETYLDTITDRVIHSKMRDQKGYKYSDLAYYILKDVIEIQERSSLKDLVQNRIYEDLGANFTTYHPLEKFDIESIAPTENDTYFRNQLLRGYVHDPGAAMQNGVGGHAGLFSNTNDMAKLMQMYLNGGVYGGKRYIKEKTLKEFTTCQYCRKDNRRGIGFDKPVIDDSDGPTCKQASPSSFGHSGFTGTLVWADPEHDLIYVFLSNRIHPSAENFILVRENFRTRIQEVIYKAIE
ncbi:serine hydrolase [Flavobacteriales bacterium]|nr:serine hydrolase [Flavobacteriales bacterium]